MTHLHTAAIHSRIHSLADTHSLPSANIQFKRFSGCVPLWTTPCPVCLPCLPFISHLAPPVTTHQSLPPSHVKSAARGGFFCVLTNDNILQPRQVATLTTERSSKSAYQLTTPVICIIQLRLDCPLLVTHCLR